MLGGFLEVFVGEGIAEALEFVGMFVVNMLVALGATNLYLKAHDNVAGTKFADLWYPKPFWAYVVGSLLVALAVLLGLILLIIPGIIVALAFIFWNYLVVERGLTPIAALKESARITKGNRWKLFALGCACAAINLLGFLALLVGILVAAPVTALALVHVYRTLAGSVVEPEVVSQPAPAPIITPTA